MGPLLVPSLFLFPSNPSLGFASRVSTAAAMCSPHWPPQLSLLPLGRSACGSLSTFTEHKLCRRLQRLATRSPVAPKIGEVHTPLL